MAVLVADQLSKEYGDIVALADFKLSVNAGDRRDGRPQRLGEVDVPPVVAGLLEPTDGVLVVASTRRIVEGGVSFVPDQPVLYSLSVNEHIEFTARLHGGEWPERADTCSIARLTTQADDLPSFQPRSAARPPGARARAPVLDPLVVEPFVGLDPHGQVR
jgi:ABC-type Na+ transport system ATPase subunit NatA